MRIKFKESIAGMTFSHKPGDEVTWPDKAEAKRLIAAGIAVAVDEVADAPRGRKRAVAPPASRPEAAHEPAEPPAAPEAAEVEDEEPQPKAGGAAKGGKNGNRKHKTGK